jgi:NAD(P)-dependent dehydrogenase (short-subunit alcohol dehydrogenase family)
VELGDRTALVTGGGHGLGLAIAGALAGAGARVALLGRNEAALESAVSGLRAAGHEAHAVLGDVTSESSVEVAVGRVIEALGRIDCLVNNAGVAPTAPLARLSLEAWNQALSVNATGGFLCLRACLPGMLERRFGRVVNIASTAGVTGGPYLSAYAASKHALVGLTRAAAAELGDKGVHVNALCPAFVDTELTRGAVERVMRSKQLGEAAALQAVLGSAGQARLLSAHEVASWVVSLCGPAGSALNGQVIVLDGGGKPS